MKKLFLLTMLVFTLIGCEKQPDVTNVDDYNGTWRYKAEVWLNDVTIFIKDGSIYSLQFNVSTSTYIANSAMYYDLDTKRYIQQVKPTGSPVGTPSFYELRMNLKTKNTLQVDIIFYSTSKIFRENLILSRI